MKSLILTALDIGSGSIKGVVGEKNLESGEIEILAIAEKSCLGIRNGEIVNPEQASLGVIYVKEELAKSSGTKIREVFTNIGGTHLFSVASQGLVSVARADQLISKDEIQRAKKEAEAISLQSNKEVIEIYPKEFIVDGEGGIKESAVLGLKGIRLETKVLLACIFSPVIHNLEKTISLSGLNSLDSFIAPMAVSRAVLSQEQKELGVAVLDIGFSVTSLAVFNKGEVVDFAVFPLGSSHITNDLAIGLRTEIQTAENIKKEFGTLKITAKKSIGDKIKLSEGDTEFSKAFLNSVVESRANEIFFEAQKALKKIMGQNLPPAGIVLTGGGSLLPGIVEFAKQKTKLPCRIGEIRGVKGIENSCFATCCGVLMLGFESMEGDGGGQVSSGRFGKKMKRILKAFLP
ncbi:MAG: cell division protein FtsA [Patescibacteria group bacterium]